MGELVGTEMAESTPNHELAAATSLQLQVDDASPSPPSTAFDRIALKDSAPAVDKRGSLRYLSGAVASLLGGFASDPAPPAPSSTTTLFKPRALSFYTSPPQDVAAEFHIPSPAENSPSQYEMDDRLLNFHGADPPLDRRRSTILRDTMAALTGTGRSHDPEPTPGSGMRRRSSLFPADAQRRPARYTDDAVTIQKSGIPAHTSLTLAQRRRSSMVPLAVETRPQSQSFLSRLLPGRSPPSSANSTEKFRTAVRVEPSPRSTKFAPLPGLAAKRDSKPALLAEDAKAARRASHALGLMDVSDTLRQRSTAKARRTRRMVIRVIAGVILLYFIVKGFSQKMSQGTSSRAGGEGKRHKKTGRVTDGTDDRSELVKFRENEIWAEPEQPLETLLVPPSGRHEETIIFVHGLAQHSWDSPLPPQLSTRFPTVRWVMPQAPMKPITVRNNESTPAWFDIRAFPYENELDEDPLNLYASARQLNALVRKERSLLIEGLRRRGGMESLPESERVYTQLLDDEDDDEDDDEVGTLAEKEWASSRIVLSGFSQGSVMALLTGLTMKDRLAGLVVISGFMPLRAELAGLISDLDRTTLPIFWGHGEADPYLLYEDALESVKLLQAKEPSSELQGGLGLSAIEFHGYPGLEHTWFPPEMEQLGNWLEKVLPTQRTMRKVGGREQGRTPKV